MPQLKFYLDTHIPKAVATQLRQQNIEVIRCEEINMAEADDTEHLEYAASHRLTLVSHDLDFLTLHAQWSYDDLFHAGIMLFHRQFHGNVGKIVKDLSEWHQLIEEGIGTLENDVYNQFIEISR